MKKKAKVRGRSRAKRAPATKYRNSHVIRHWFAPCSVLVQVRADLRELERAVGAEDVAEVRGIADMLRHYLKPFTNVQPRELL